MIEPYYQDSLTTLYQGDVLETLWHLPDESVHCCVSSPPYFALRDYGVKGQIGLEPTPEKYIAKMVKVYEEVRRVLRSDGVCFVNIGDSYAGSWGNYHPRKSSGKARATPQKDSQMESASIRRSSVSAADSKRPRPQAQRPLPHPLPPCHCVAGGGVVGSLGHRVGQTQSDAGERDG